MNVLVVSSKYPPEYAGSALRAHTTYLRLRSKYDINVKVICSSITNNRSKRYYIDHIFVHRISNKRTIDFTKNPKVLRSLIERFLNIYFQNILKLIEFLIETLTTYFTLIKYYSWIDVIHVFGNVTVTSSAITFAKITGKPIVIELVNLVEKPGYFEPQIISYFWGKGFPTHAKIIAISKALENNCIKNGVKREKIWCRPNPIDENRFYLYEKMDYRVDKNNKTRNINLVHLAKIMPLKNQLFLVDVMKYLPINFFLTITGPLVDSGPLANRDNKYLANIKDKISYLGLNERIKVSPGFVENPEEIIKKADVFLYPSIKEAFGTPVLEALACGVPVVASSIPGVFDQWIMNGNNGFTCDLDPQHWAKKIIEATNISNNKMAQSAKAVMSKASTAVIDEEYNKLLNSSLVIN